MFLSESVWFLEQENRGTASIFCNKGFYYRNWGSHECGWIGAGMKFWKAAAGGAEKVTNYFSLNYWSGQDGKQTLKAKQMKTS